MQKFIRIPLILAVVLVSLQSCRSDDDGDDNDIGNNNNNSLNNQISINGEVFDLADAGVLEGFGELGIDSGIYKWTIDISPPVTVGVFMDFDLFNDSSEGLVDGMYTFSIDRETFTYDSVDIEVDLDNASMVANPEEGTIEIDTDGNITTVALDLIGRNGEIVLGNWSGVLEVD